MFWLEKKKAKTFALHMCGCVCTDRYLYFFTVSMNGKPDGVWWSLFSQGKEHSLVPLATHCSTGGITTELLFTVVGSI